MSWYLIKKMLIQPLELAGEHFQRMAKGDLSSHIRVESKNEIGTSPNFERFFWVLS